MRGAADWLPCIVSSVIRGIAAVLFQKTRTVRVRSTLNTGVQRAYSRNCYIFFGLLGE